MKALVFNDQIQTALDPSFPMGTLPEGWTVEDVPAHAQPGWRRRGGTFEASSPGAQDFHKNYTNAQIAKREHWLSDAVMVRCFESGIVAPTVWRNYRATLRAIIALENDTTGTAIEIPPKPDLPAGI